MGDRHLGHQDARHPNLGKAALEVYFFAVHVEALVHALYPFVYSAGHHHAGAHNPVGSVGPQGGAGTYIVPCPAMPQARGFEACQGCEPFPRDMPHGGEFAGYPLVFSVVTDYLGAGEHLRIGGERRKH